MNARLARQMVAAMDDQAAGLHVVPKALAATVVVVRQDLHEVVRSKRPHAAEAHVPKAAVLAADTVMTMHNLRAPTPTWALRWVTAIQASAMPAITRVRAVNLIQCVPA